MAGDKLARGNAKLIIGRLNLRVGLEGICCRAAHDYDVGRGSTRRTNQAQSATNIGQRVAVRSTPELCGNRLGHRTVNQLSRDFAGIAVQADNFAREDALAGHPFFGPSNRSIEFLEIQEHQFGVAVSGGIGRLDGRLVIKLVSGQVPDRLDKRWREQARQCFSLGTAVPFEKLRAIRGELLRPVVKIDRDQI